MRIGVRLSYVSVCVSLCVSVCVSLCVSLMYRYMHYWVYHFIYWRSSYSTLLNAKSEWIRLAFNFIVQGRKTIVSRAVLLYTLISIKIFTLTNQSHMLEYIFLHQNVIDRYPSPHSYKTKRQLSTWVNNYIRMRYHSYAVGFRKTGPHSYKTKKGSYSCEAGLRQTGPANNYNCLFTIL